ncbi:MAG: sigma-70 family RNA polymerase sigma factor [Planctomycetaceae bacterium]|nr:sigma-70 family RNA polymerase sigma factor [Planctomycetaceae bacterium]
MTRYKNPVMKQLADQQVRYAPQPVRLEQMQRAEELIGELSPRGTYRYEDLCQKLTNFRPDRYPNLTLTGDEAAHDLHRFVEDLSDSANLTTDMVDEPVLSLEDVSERYHVSIKTVTRWRQRGLVGRRFRVGSRKQIGFLESSVRSFVLRHRDEVARGSRFSQLTDEEKLRILGWARRLAKWGANPSQVVRRAARKFERAPETIRYTLKQYDKQNPENAVFPQATDPLSDAEKRELYRLSRLNVSVEKLVTKFRRTRSSVYRLISEMRARNLIDHPIEFMDHDSFRQPDADEVILGPPPAREESDEAHAQPAGLPAYLESLYQLPLLTREEEGYYFRKMNYLKFKVEEMRKSLDPQRPKSGVMRDVEQLLEESLSIKNFLIRSNLRLVVSIAKKHMRPNTNFFEMVSDGNMSLLRAIEKFDYSRGNKFSTYASWAIMKNFARTIPAEHTLHERYKTGADEVFLMSSDNRGDQFQAERENHTQHDILMKILERLDPREREILLLRFGLRPGDEPKTLEEVGHRFGVTKERARQLEARGLKKLRQIAADEKLDIPGI